MPRAFLVPDCRIVLSDEEMVEALFEKEFDPTQTVLLEERPGFFDCGDKKNPRRRGGKGQVEIKGMTFDSIQLEVNSPQRQLLFLSESHYPGWMAKVNGQEVKIHRANMVFRAIVVPPGKSKVEMSNQPPLFYVGAGVSLTTLMVCGIAIFGGKRAA